MINFDITKEHRIDIGIDKFIQAGCNGIFNYVPRFGKTRAGLKCASKVTNLINVKSVFIIVPNDIILAQWYDALATYNVTCMYDEQLKDIEIITINKLVNAHEKLDKNYGIVIFDEPQKYLSDKRVEILNNEKIKSNCKLGLTGTMPVGEDYDTLTAVMPIVDVIDEATGIANGWISRFNEYNYAINFNENEELAYVKYTRIIRDTLVLYKGISNDLYGKPFNVTLNGRDYITRPMFKNDYDVIMKCLAGYYDSEINQYISRDMLIKMVGYVRGFRKDLDLSSAHNKTLHETWSSSAIYETCNKYKEVVNSRNRLMTDSPNKLAAAMDIVDKFKDSTMIIFTGSTTSATQLTDMINDKYGQYAVCYHSKVETRYYKDDKGEYIKHKNGNPIKFGSTRLKKYAIEGIKNGKLKVLVTVNSLDEGLNIPTINFAMTLFGSTNPIQHIQRTARAKTINPDNVDEIVTIINVFFNDIEITEDDKEITVNSRDKVKLLSRQSTISTNVINIDNLKLFENN